MNTKQLETFVWVAKLRSFRKAALYLGATQPAISARIRELERQLGVLERASQTDQRGEHLVAGVAHRVGTTCPGKAMPGRTALMRDR